MADKIPDLDDLLKSIRDEGKPQSSSALAVIPKAEKKGTDVVDEDIDPLILRLLGLGDVFDIDYDTYKTLLREKMAAGRMPGSQMPTEEIELLTNEFKRVKGKTGRFKVKAQKIKAESFVAKKKQPTTTRKPLKALPGTVGPKPAQIKPVAEPQEEKVDQSMKLLADKISDANNNIKKIVDTDKKKNDLERKKGEKDRVSAERTRKVIREERAERGKMASGMKNALSSAIAPVKGVIDVIGDFLKRFLIGTAIMELIKLLEMGPAAYFQPIFDWMNGIIKKLEDSIKDLINKIVSPINRKIEEFNNGVVEIVDQINNEFNKLNNIGIDIPDIPSPSVPLIPTPDPDQQILPRIPNIFGTPMGSPAQPAASQPASGTPLSGPPGQTLATGAKASWYNPGLGGINSGTGRRDPNARTSTGERYDKNKFTAAAFPSLISKLPRSMTTPSQDPNWGGIGRTLAPGNAFNVVVTDSKTGKQAVVRINDVGSGVAGQDPKRMMDFSVATRDYFGAGGGPYTVQMAPSGAKLGPVTKTSAPAASAPGSSPTASPVSAPASPSQNQGKMVTFGGQTFYQKPDGTLTHPSAAPASAKSQSPTPSVAKVAAAKPNVPPPAAPGTGGVTAIPIPVASGNQQAQQTNTSTANQYGTPTFSAYDKTNPSFLVIKSIYNIVG